MEFIYHKILYLELPMSNVYYGRMARAKIRPSEIRIGFIGAGRLGTAFAFHCARLGYGIAGVYDINPECVRRLGRLLGRDFKGKGIKDLARDSDVLFLTVPDKAIRPVFKMVREYLAPATVVVHCAGAFGIEVFDQEEALALHPIQTFLNPKQAIAALPKGYFALEGTEKGLGFGKRLVRQLKGRAIVIKGKDRPLYHSMCVFASNFINGLFAGAEEIGKKLGLSPSQTVKLLFPLAMATMENIRENGAVLSLTGPVKRGDKITVRRHIQALKERLPGLVPIYWELTRYLTKKSKERQGNEQKAPPVP